MVQEGGTPGDKKNKSHDLQKKRTALEHELELRFGLLALYQHVYCKQKGLVHTSDGSGVEIGRKF